MTAAGCCAACGYDAAAVVGRSWTFFVEQDAKSMNARSVNSGTARFAYAKERDAWIFRIRMAASSFPDVPDLRMHASDVNRRRVTLTRQYGGRQRAYDYGNLVGGLKGCVDALVACGILADDDEAHAQIIYKQAKATPTGLSFLVEELADA